MNHEPQIREDFPCPHCKNTTWLPKISGWICSKCRYFTWKLQS